jgi:putative FmdB family regulatory protein
MPTYEYECAKCGHLFEKFQGINDAPLKQCPKCRGRVKRLLGTGAGLLFKGSGFYITDYRSEGYKQAAKADVKPHTPAPAADKPAASTEKKPAPKSGKGKAS